MEHIPYPVVTTGSFDGVHVGHKVIINRLNQLASEIGGESVLITFYPHPRKVLYPDTAGKNLKLLTSENEKIDLLRSTGLDNLIIINFTLEFSKTSPGEFVEKYLLKKLNASIIVVGFNHFFGHNREGNYDYLLQLQEKYGFRVEEIPEQDIQHECVSSTRVRKALNEGDIQRASAYMEHFYIMRGKLSRGHGLLDEEGIITLKISLEEEMKLIPVQGVYAIRLETGSHSLKGILNIKDNTLDKPEKYRFPLVEFILVDDCIENIEGKQGTIYFHKRIRECRHFDSPQKLKKQIKSDIRLTEELIY